MNVDLNDYKSIFCHEGGYAKTFCFSKAPFTSTKNRTIVDYAISFSIIPPPSTAKGCFINVWYQTRLLSTLRIHFSVSTSQKNQEADEQQGWRIEQDNGGAPYNRYHYRIFNRVMLKNRSESEEGNVKINYKFDLAQKVF